MSDRFGLWLSFYPVRQAEYLDMVNRAVSCDWLIIAAPARSSDPVFAPDHYRMEALRWALARGARNGRSAEHFARHWVGQQLLNND